MSKSKEVVALGFALSSVFFGAGNLILPPFLGTSSILTSSVYFILVFLFVINRSKILNLGGKFLTS